VRTHPQATNQGVIHMMRKLTATGLAVVAVAGLGGAGAAFAASSHSAKPAAAAISQDRSANDKTSVDRHASSALSHERSSRDGSRDTHARTTDLRSGHSESGR